MRVARSIDLPCSPQEAWATLTCWERQVDWMADADRIDVVSEHREGAGVRLSVRTRVFQVPAFTEAMEVVGWDPPRRLEIAHGAPVTGLGTWSLEPVTGGTTFTWMEHVELEVPIVGASLAACYAPITTWLIGRSQRSLRSLIVASGPARH